MTNREKKQILLQFGEIDRHIKELQNESSLWRSRAENASATLSGEPKGAGTAGGRLERSVERIIEIEKQIESETDELFKIRRKIITAVKALPDMRERRIVYLCYIGKICAGGYKRLKLVQIAEEMNYSEKHIRRLHSAALFHIRFD